MESKKVQSTVRGYIHESTATQTSSLSAQRQKELIQTFADDRKCTAEFYSDIGGKRSGLFKLLKDLTENDTVVVFCLAILSRNIIDAENILAIIKKCKAKFVSLDISNSRDLLKSENT